MPLPPPPPLSPGSVLSIGESDGEECIKLEPWVALNGFAKEQFREEMYDSLVLRTAHGTEGWEAFVLVSGQVHTYRGGVAATLEESLRKASERAIHGIVEGNVGSRAMRERWLHPGAVRCGA